MKMYVVCFIDLQRWIEPLKPLKKQIRFVKPPSSSKKASILSSNGELRSKFSSKSREQLSTPSNPSAIVYFRVKFFVEDPSKLQEEYTKFHVYLQLRKDINENRLLVSPGIKENNPYVIIVCKYYCEVKVKV